MAMEQGVLRFPWQNLDQFFTLHQGILDGCRIFPINSVSYGADEKQTTVVTIGLPLRFLKRPCPRSSPEPIVVIPFEIFKALDDLRPEYGIVFFSNFVLVQRVVQFQYPGVLRSNC